MWKVLKNIICEKLTHIDKLPDDSKIEYKEDEITEGLNTFLSTLDKIYQSR